MLRVAAGPIPKAYAHSRPSLHRPDISKNDRSSINRRWRVLVAVLIQREHKDYHHKCVLKFRGLPLSRTGMMLILNMTGG